MLDYFPYRVPKAGKSWIAPAIALIGGMYAEKMPGVPPRGISAQCVHCANYYGVHSENTLENHPPTEVCIINLKLWNSNVTCSQGDFCQKTYIANNTLG